MERDEEAIRRKLLPGIGVCILLAALGEAVARISGLPVPGAVIGMLGYAAWLASGRRVGWTRPGAWFLLRWLGALIVPPLVVLPAMVMTMTGEVAAALGLVLLVTTLVTALATAAIYRLMGGRD